MTQFDYIEPWYGGVMCADCYAWMTRVTSLSHPWVHQLGCAQRLALEKSELLAARARQEKAVDEAWEQNR